MYPPFPLRTYTTLKALTNTEFIDPIRYFKASADHSLDPQCLQKWNCYDGYTGDFMFSATGVPTGTAMLGPEGEYLIVSLVNLGSTAHPNYYMQEWNSSRLWGNNYSGSSTSPPVIPPISEKGKSNSKLDRRHNDLLHGVPVQTICQACMTSMFPFHTQTLLTSITQ